MSNFIPRNPEKFDEYVYNIIKYVKANLNRWKRIPEEVIQDLSRKFDIFHEAMKLAISVRTSGNIEARRETQKACESALRFLIRFYLRHPSVSDADLKEMGIPPIDTIRTMHKQVDELVDFVLRPVAIRTIRIDFWQEGHTHKAKPKGYDGAVLITSIGDKAPADYKGFDDHRMASRTPFTLEFRNEDRGKTVWITLAWQNNRGIRGRWSDFKSAVIP